MGHKMMEHHKKWWWRWRKVIIKMVNDNDDDSKTLGNISVRIGNSRSWWLITPYLDNHLPIYWDCIACMVVNAVLRVTSNNLNNFLNWGIKNNFVDLMSDSAFLSNKSHYFEEVFFPQIMSNNSCIDRVPSFYY